MISLLGKTTSYLSLIESLHSIVKVMKKELEPYIKDLLSKTSRVASSADAIEIKR